MIVKGSCDIALSRDELVEMLAKLIAAGRRLFFLQSRAVH